MQVDQQDLQPLIFGSHRHGDCHILMPLFCESPLIASRWHCNTVWQLYVDQVQASSHKSRV